MFLTEETAETYPGPSTSSGTADIKTKQDSGVDGEEQETETGTEECHEQYASKIWQADTFDLSDVRESRSALDNNTKRNILNSVLLPKQPYLFPSTDFKTQKRKFQESWIRDPIKGYPFLAYSKKEDAVFCKPCFLFFHDGVDGVGKGSHEDPGSIVASGFKDWKRATTTFKDHVSNEYYKACVNYADQFMQVMERKQLDIKSQLNKKHDRDKEENRAAIRPIIETILFCAEQELPLRGDVDSGPLSLEKPASKDGKFRALLRLRANSADENLRRHVINCARNASYISPKIQNEVLQTCSDIVTEDIVTRINKSSCFTILADETMDVSGVEQLSLCVRYVDRKSDAFVLREDFVGFIPIYDQSAESLAKTILEKCQHLQLDMDKCVGQVYDGASNMSGHLSGVQTRIKEDYPKARYYHCASHRLNLALSNTFSISSVRNCLGTVNEVINFFRNNAYANNALKLSIYVYSPESSKQRLTRLCETRFIERHGSVITFVELFKCIVISLEEISGKSFKSSSTAATLLAAVEKSEF